MSYNKYFDRDEIDQIECKVCGIPCLAVDMENDLCPICLDAYAKEENLEFAKEEFNKAMERIMEPDNQKAKVPFFATGYLQSLFARIATEDQLWDVTNAINKHIDGAKK